MKKLFTLICLLSLAYLSKAQGNFTITGHIEDSLGNPVANHEVYVYCDSLTPGPSGYFTHNAVVYTDANGDYIDVVTNGTEPGYNYDFYVYTSSCNSFLPYTGMVSTSNGTLSNGTYDFTIDCSPAPPIICSVNFYSWQDTNSFFGNDTVYLLLNSTSNAPSSTTIFWDFGDGNTSTDWYPAHTYANPGAYYVCVTIFDSSDSCTATHCDSVYDMTRAGMTIQAAPATPNNLDNLQIKLNQELFPNPFNNELNLSLGSEINTTIIVNLFDATGKNCQHNKHQISKGNNQLKLSSGNFDAGIYMLQIMDEHGRTITCERVVKY